MLQTSSHAGKQPACAQAGSNDHAGSCARSMSFVFSDITSLHVVFVGVCVDSVGVVRGNCFTTARGEPACDDCNPDGGRVCADYRSENAYITLVVARAHSHAPRAGHSSSSMMAPTASSSLSSSRRDSPPAAISCSPISLGHSIGPFRKDGAMIKAMSTPSGHM